MAKNGSHGTDEAERIDEQVEDPAGSLLDRGRAVAEQLPNAVDGAWGVIAAAHGQVDDLSDQGVITAVAFSAGITMGLFLAGAPPGPGPRSDPDRDHGTLGHPARRSPGAPRQLDRPTIPTGPTRGCAILGARSARAG